MHNKKHEILIRKVLSSCVCAMRLHMGGKTPYGYELELTNIQGVAGIGLRAEAAKGAAL